MAKTNRSKRTQPVMNIYHVTQPQNIELIEHDGLVAGGDGRIFAFTDLIAADTIATNQVFADPYALFLIMGVGITGECAADDVAEMAAAYHLTIAQDRIAPEHLMYLGTHSVRADVMMPWHWQYYQMLGLNRHQAKAAFDELRQKKAEAVQANE